MKKQQLATLILRVVFGFTFLIHGISKFQGGISNTVGYFDSLGLPGFLAYVIAIIELVGGLLLIIGFGTRVIGALFAVIMIGAIFSAKLSLGLLGDGVSAGYELELVFLAIGVYFVLANPTNLSLDEKLSQKNR
ncbi:DoxX family protein [Psychrobacillus sp. INOP01]|uniref:DoxX family protein n=1 Tax=Psychrobacillus sp. INOP01 TaxID=2829187 RepID=UPI001BA56B49|nr:DoxX family protein [Psychrobacillus sp. INOP01]QUG40014.1 DoxX family protein [Psychrobacillus sp. INOP01]